ncbi:unnamed protein product [Spirodela intermedia]|uniref:Uncharacterized protein n=1 Tax=Spirodela intermedia TaxID=51605 RepID=A0A7I8JLS0_SPIIN|nr:unnamed protein product [Spirodela intermedia]CAA6670731.1 unnamed protein product [Spirodela intermedia]
MSVGRERRPHVGCLQFPLLAMPREETHDHCRHCHYWKGEGMSWPTYGVLQGASRERGGAGHPHICIDNT